VLDPEQAGNLQDRMEQAEQRLQSLEGLRTLVRPNARGPVIDPNQAGNLQRRLDEAEAHIRSIESKTDILPLVRLSGFFQLDMGQFSQIAKSVADLGNLQNGIGFRRTRLQAIGKLTEFTNFSIEMDFATVGRPSFMDVWGEQTELPFLGTIRIGQFRQPSTMDGWTSIRHLDFLERSAPFQALDPFRRVGIMSYAMSDDERTMWAYSIYGTGLTFSTGGATNYSTLGDTRYGTQIGDSGGVSFVIRATHLLYYDEPSDGRYLLHIGGGYNFSQIGGNRDSIGPDAKTYEARALPEFYVGDQAGFGPTSAGTPPVIDTGRFLASSYNLYHTELAGNYGPAHFQTEFMLSTVNQLAGPTVVLPGAYIQCGYFLTGESAGYIKQAGVLDYTVVPYAPFFGLGRHCGMGGWGAWEVAFRWSYVDLGPTNILPANQLSSAAGPPPAPNLGNLNQSTVALNWWWNKFTRLQFNWIHGMPDYNTIGFAPYDIFATRFQVEF
jgi:phosphate-selective porin OprO/OprP